MDGTRLVKVITAFGAAVFLALGVWAFAAPRSFYDVVATYPPYNLHLFHDAGAFQIGIGAALLAALVWRDALSVALAGVTAGAVVHAVSHILDRDLGGRPSDPAFLSALAVLFAAGLAVRLRASRPRRPTGA
ncbi:hypothetical protein [Alloactinosynnema sp. L-07]|uniref:hypothetical protein n=1 Tax=Alloactinosynnema sp. L-07 TaxID=1653480 RepID=UPI00065EEFF0|nr:hypothetical protein [Alloactinosynnema sp. L-07]CRK61769.1 hypothetical protein [Alloactinosynnema sp. L-07]